MTEELATIKDLIRLMDFGSSRIPYDSKKNDYSQIRFLALFEEMISSKPPYEIIRDLVENRRGLFEDKINFASVVRFEFENEDQWLRGLENSKNEFSDLGYDKVNSLDPKYYSLLLPLRSREQISYGQFTEFKYSNEVFFSLLSFLELAIKKNIDINKIFYDQASFWEFMTDANHIKDFITINPNFTSWRFGTLNSNELTSKELFEIYGKPRVTPTNPRQVLLRLCIALLCYDKKLLVNITSGEMFDFINKYLEFTQKSQFDEAFSEARIKLKIEISLGRPRARNT